MSVAAKLKDDGREKSAREDRAMYDADFYGWTLAQSPALREGRLAELDLAHLAEEIGDLGKEQFSKLESALRLIVMHLLKWDRQPDRCSRSWVISIRRERMNVRDLLRDNPGLKPRQDEALERAYRRARLDAAEETELPMSRFPVECPYVFEEILDRPIERPDT